MDSWLIGWLVSVVSSGWLIGWLLTGCLRRNWLGWVSCSSVSYIKSIPTHEKIFAVGKSGPNAAFNLIFLGLGWPWMGSSAVS